ncbi:hypothetical protein G3N55_00205 [Dissulfurirhabdus thermomarina]|uniref:PCRF domain-containing protein n=1 Tax=Dissulfurirhabdus thermomarina TaxID=1765737 RepID=A0A6N9TJ43_DISTH|nr:hypothetical protein [Dissulfurirhabdus thermomarina]NDY41272.1 hypothetical protein [Dissulfurirhabdus thermomarina]
MSEDLRTLLLEELPQIRAELRELRQMVARLVEPAAALSVSAKAEAIRRALASGDPQALRATYRQINGQV